MRIPLFGTVLTGMAAAVEFEAEDDAMLKLVFVLRRKPALTREEFQHTWREDHAPLVHEHAPALRIRRYVQCHTEEGVGNEALRQSRNAMAEFDGVAELWFRRIDLAVQNTPEAQAAGLALLDDERRFIDLERSALWWTVEHEIVS